MKRRKYLFSTLGAGAGLGFISKYNIQQSIATDIDITLDTIDIPTDINEIEDTPQLKINFNKFKIIENNYHGANPDYTIEARTIYNDKKVNIKKLQKMQN